MDADYDCVSSFFKDRNIKFNPKETATKKTKPFLKKCCYELEEAKRCKEMEKNRTEKVVAVSLLKTYVSER
jgi:hypothetical protein